MLTASERQAFRDTGYIMVPGLIEAVDRARYDKRFVDLAHGLATLPPGMIAMRDVMVVKGAVDPVTPLHAINKILNFEADPVLFDYARDQRVHGIARQLVDATQDEPLYVITTNVFNKPPGVDGRHPLHQDLRYFRLRPAGGIVAAWTALAPCTRETGCLAVLPGSHLGELRAHGDPDWDYVNRAFYGVEGVDRAAAGACRDATRRHSVLPSAPDPRLRTQSQRQLPARHLGALRLVTLRDRRAGLEDRPSRPRSRDRAGRLRSV